MPPNQTSFKVGQIPWNKGLTKADPRVRKYCFNSGSIRTGEHRSLATEFKKGQKMPWATEKNRKINANPKTREKHRVISKKLCQDPTYIAKISHNKEMRQYLSELQGKRMRNPAIRRRLSEMTKKQMADPKIREHLSQLAKGRLADPEYRRKVLLSRRPTDIEQIVIDIISKYNLPYKYTGNGSFLIGRLNPDFVNINGKKIAIDVFGDRWHEPSEVPERTAIFAEYGWTLIIIWGHEVKELSESKLLSKMRN